MRGAKGEQPSATDDKAAMIQREFELTEALKKKTEELHAAQRQVEELTRATRDLDAVRASFATADAALDRIQFCLLYTSPSPRDATLSRMPSSA